jgi:hypothetical protein
MAFNIGLLSEESDDGSEGLDTEETIGGEEEQAPEEADGEDAGEEAAPEESADAPEEEQEVAPEDKPRPEAKQRD